MKVELKPDYEVSEASCKNCTGKSLAEWSAALDATPPANRREGIQYLYGEMAKDPWWPTTVWVEHEKAKNIVQKDGRGEGYNICVTKSVCAPISEVYKAFTSEKLTQWFGQGASFNESGRIQDGEGNGGKLLRVRQDKDLRFAWRTLGSVDDSQVDVMFAEKAGKTGITLNHMRIQSRAEADGLRRAWSDALASLKSAIESK
jgi:uncharacterized protein YndB with AHSA1/START domain